MHKHCERLEKRLKQQEQERLQAEMVEAKKREGTSTPPCGSPEMRGRRTRQHLLDPIRRWNSFHNSRDRKQQRTTLPYLQTLELYRKQTETRSSDVFANICAEIAKDPDSNYMPITPQGSESLDKASRVLGTNIANELIALSLANLKEAAKSPTRKQFSSPNLIDPMKNSPRNRRTSSDSYPIGFSGDKYSTPKITKTFSTSNPDDLPNSQVMVPRVSVSESPCSPTPLTSESSTSGVAESLRKTSSSSSTVSSPRVLALRTESACELLASSPLSSSLPSDVGLTPPSAPQMPRRRFSVCFGKRTGGSARRPNECFVLEPSEMIVIDYPEMQAARGVGNPRLPSTMDRGGVNLVFDDSFARPELYQKSNRSSHSSDTSSAYSGSDTMTSVHSSVDADDVDLSGLVESVVDSDEEDLAESTDSLTLQRDSLRECLEKDPSERSEDDIEILLELTQHLKAFTNMTLAVRRALCSVMVFAVVEKAGTVVMNDGEELDSWSVLINGHVEVEHANGHIEHLQMGDSFGILPTMERLYHRGVMRTKCDDCQFVCITQQDYYKIQHQGEENTRRHEENGALVMVTEQRGALEGGRRGPVVIRATPEKLMLQLVEENSVIDPTYVEDFLLTHRTFIDSSELVTDQLLQWFTEQSCRDRVTRVVLLWVNNHFTDFETDPQMMEFLELFEAGLEREAMTGQLRLLNIACAAKARARCVTLARPSRDEVLHFSILGGYERGFGIFISKVDKRSKAEDVGLKRGDQILEVNGQSFEHVSHAKALEILRGTTHLSITVKSNLLAFKEMLQTPDTSPRARVRKTKEIARIQNDPRARLDVPPPPPPPPPIPSSPSKLTTPQSVPTPTKVGSFMTLGPKKRMQKALMKMNILPKNTIKDGTVSDDVTITHHHNTTLYHSNPDLMSICYDDLRVSDYPEHVLKVYKSDQTCKYLLVHKETTAHEVVMLALQEFGMTEPSSHFSLCEVSVAEGGIIKTKRLPDQLQNLAERIGLSSRYYLKTNGSTETLVGDDLASELVRENQVHFLQLNAVEVAVQLTLQDFSIFRQIESTEYIDDLFDLKSRYGTPMLSQFAELVNKEMFWVVTEVCSEHNLVRRSKIIKQFIKVARQCKECKNFNSMFAIVSGLGHGAVSRLRLSWEKLPSKYQRLFSDLQDLMDPSRNMSKYRQLVSNEQSQPPIIPFYPVVKKDLTFIHLGNDSRVEGLVNFEKLRMIAKEVRTLTNMCSSPYDLLTMLELGGQPPSSAMVALNQLTTGGNPAHQTGGATVKRRKKSTAAPNPKKMFEEAQMVRRVKAYLNKMRVMTDEDKLHELSVACEGGRTGGDHSAPNSAPLRKRNPSPTLSTTSSASSASEGRKPTAPKFGSASPQSVRKLLSLSETSKTRPHQPRHPPHPLASPAPSPGSPRRVGGRGHSHERSHSDTPPTHPAPPPLLSSVDLNAESSSVTSLSNLPLRKTLTSGSVTSSDSGHSTQLDSHSNSSVEVGGGGLGGSSPPHRRHSVMQPPAVCIMPPPSGRIRQPPPAYSVAAQLAARQHRLGRAHSHEGVTSHHPHNHAHYHHDEDDDEDVQVSAV
ncbi:rap guanine nucleotide exchange factor 2 isoform X3 [Macrosteles quadrilineatus]|uniref:rap guanine nucleotide exchange factor 2 isoform X3 n=1 Tax=Macrosteles quadrilineatus TaxID=74068 RepID=UPI0023E166F5|nr:rap guanine nucleotide exchange factor 2 isoform X3 [Macrosteles quadrilineatus]